MDFALILDIVVIVILLISSVVAFLRGFVREVLTILGLGGAALTALVMGPEFAPGIEQWLLGDLAADTEEKLWGIVPYDIAAMVMAYAGVFVVTLIVLSIISHYIAKSVHALGLGPVDRSLGVVFGIVRALLLIGLLYMPFHILMEEEEKEEWFANSHSYSYVEFSSDFILGFMPESWRLDKKDSEGADEEADPLKDLTGENDEPAADPAIGTDEGAAEETTQPSPEANSTRTLQDSAVEILIDNQDKIQELMQRQSGSQNE
jgi:membrane protein required for colicin V production